MATRTNHLRFSDAPKLTKAVRVNRRDILRLAAVGGLSLNGSALSGLLSAGEMPRPRHPLERPNIVLVITDQQHASMMSCTGNRWLKTPAMDALAARGVRFERAYCANPVCVPSRFSMMTGALPSRIGMDRNESASFPVDTEILEHSLGHVFRAAGYRTVYGGKVHLPGAKGKGIAAYGFETLTGNEREGLAEACRGFLRERHKQPFLLVASFINPHDICYLAIDAFTQAEGLPLMYPNSARERECLAEATRIPGVAREEFFARVCPSLAANFKIPENEPAVVRESDWRPFRRYVQESWTEEDWRMHRWAYARLTERVDAHIGKVLDTLRDTGLDRRTVVVFTSDHGDMDGAHRLEHKSMPYEEAIRVPLIVSGPGLTTRGHIDRTHLVSTGLDLIPTLCDLAGFDAPASLTGCSVKPLARASQTHCPWRDSLVIENERSRILISGRYKYAVYDHGESREMLIDLGLDPGEMQNLAVDPDYADVLVHHRRLLRRWYDENRAALDGKYVVAS